MIKKLFVFIILCGGIAAGLYFSGMLNGMMGEDEDSYEEEEEVVTATYTAPEPIAPPVIQKPQRQYWEKTGVDWKKYQRVQIDAVKVIGNSNMLSMRDQQMLGSYFQNAMRNAVQRKYRVVNSAGEGVLRVEAEITGVTSAGNAGEGNVAMNGRLVDSVTGDVLVKISDSKSGALFSSTAIWGDITKGFDNWAEQLFGLLVNKLGHDIVYHDPVEDAEKAKILELLKLAERDLFSNRLTTPEGNNALERYREVLFKDANNKQAKNGIEKVVKKYVAWGERALRRNNIDSAEIYLDKARDILDTHPAVLRLEALLRGGTVVNTAPASVSVAQTAPAEATPVAVETAPPVAAMTEEPTSSAPAEETAAPETATTEAAPVAAPEPKAFDPWNGKPGVGSASFSGSKVFPFMLGLETTGEVAKIVIAAKKRLTDAGFEIAGEYSPYAGTHVIAVTNATLKQNAAKSEFGGYGAAIRVAIAKVGEQVQVTYTNPVYMAKIYRMNGDLSSVANKLGTALGKDKTFGSKKGVKQSGLKKWHYMFGMPYFDDQDVLAKSADYQSAVGKVEAGLASGKGGTKKVYRIDIPGKDETLFGVAITQGKGSDATIMQAIDVGAIKHAAHLPYEILVSGGKAYALNGKFRIALSFPDLTMGQFASIKSAPGAIESSLKAVAE